MTNNADNNTALLFKGIPIHVWQEAFCYDPAIGTIRWREERAEEHFTSLRRYRIWKTKNAGKIATSERGNGYLRVSLTYQGGRRVAAQAHRLAWLLHYGAVPTEGLYIDHVNGQRDDNRIGNLRLVSNAENLRAFHRPRGGSSAYRGVARHKQRGSWQANIRRSGIRRSLGLFDNEHAAALAFNIASEALGFAEEAGNIIPAVHLHSAITDLRVTQRKLAAASREGWATKLTLRYQQFAQSGVVFTPKPEAIAKAA